MRVRKCTVLIVPFVLLAFFAGCAAFREGNVPRVKGPSRGAMEGQRTISLEVQGAVILSGKIYQTHPKTMKDWRKQTVKAYEDSGMFLEVTDGADDADFHAEVMIVDRGKPNAFLAFITGLTLYVIPSKATDEFTVKTTISDRDGKTVGTFEKSETVSLWQQLFLVFAMPFNWPSSVAKEALYDLNRATISDAHAHGIFATEKHWVT
jgi:hypothetical protein